VNELFESVKKRRKGSGQVVGSYDSRAPSKKNAEIKLRFCFEQGLIEKKGWRMGTTMGHLMVSDRIEEKRRIVKKRIGPTTISYQELYREGKKGQTERLLDNSNLAKKDDRRRVVVR
jgi:hypothetical protein